MKLGEQEVLKHEEKIMAMALRDSHQEVRGSAFRCLATLSPLALSKHAEVIVKQSSRQDLPPPLGRPKFRPWFEFSLPRNLDHGLFSCILFSFLPPFAGPPLFLPFSRYLSAPFSPSKSALFCRANCTAQSLERGRFRMDLSADFGKEIPSRNMRAA